MKKKKIVSIAITILSVFSLLSCWTSGTIYDGDFEFKKSKAKANELILTKYNGDDFIVEIPEKIQTSSVTKIARNAFVNNYSMNKLVLSNNLNIIEDGAFRDCKNLKVLDMQKINNTIKFENFKNNGVDVKKIYVSDIEVWLNTAAVSGPIRGYESDLYVDNNLIIHLDIPENIEKIGNYAFDSSLSLETVNISSSVKSIGENGFNFSKKLKSVKFSSNSQLESLGGYSFYGCQSLTSIDLPDGLKEIGAFAFRFCDNLNSIFIPKSVKYIGPYAFDGCSKLTIYCEHEKEPYEWDYDWNIDNRPVVWGSSGINS